jgi:uncharacterized membrane protein
VSDGGITAPRSAENPRQTRAAALGAPKLEKTSTGLDENVAGALAYGLGWITGVALLVTERENRFVRFHAMQSTIVFGGLCALWFVGLSIPPVGSLISLFVIPPLSATLWLLLLFKAYRGVRFKLPYVGDMAEERS